MARFLAMLTLLSTRSSRTTASFLLQRPTRCFRRNFFDLFRGGAAAETTDLAASRSHPRLLHERYPVSVSSIQGMRKYMEDEFTIHENFVGVFDGHGGAAISQYLRLNLYGLLLQSSNSATSSDHQAMAALRTTLAQLDEQVCRIQHWSFQGSTVVAVWFVTPTRLVVAGIGDSRAIVASHDGDVEHVLQLTRDHRPDCPDEIDRIESLGGSVISVHGVPRVNGNLALSRAVGDRSERPAVSGEPDMAIYDIQEGKDEFVILGTDGLFDVMSNEECVEFVHGLIEEHDTNGDQREYFASLLVEEALRRGSYDNITVVIVWLQ